MVHDSYEIAVMHPKAAPYAGLGLASHDALGVTDFSWGYTAEPGTDPRFALGFVLSYCFDASSGSRSRTL